jgi:hypothetical protein
MTLPYDERIINDGEISPNNFISPNFVGYLSPTGIPIDYSLPFGLGGHDNNPTTDYFMEYYIIRTKPYINYEKSGFLPLDYYRKRQSKKNNGQLQTNEEKNDIELCSVRRKRINDILTHLKEICNNMKQYDNNPFHIMDRDIMQFIANCYSNGAFNKGIGRDIRFMGKQEFYDKYFYFLSEEREKKYPREKTETNEQYYSRISTWYNFDYQYDRYINSALLDVLKEVFVCYLGYHSVERTPKTITTSVPNIYETFYNYLLNDFTIFQLPRMVFDENLKTYFETKQNEFFIPDSELRLKDEIQAIKRLVPINQRKKYYR